MSFMLVIIPESFIGKIKKGAEVKVEIPVLNKSFNSTIKHSVSSINELSRTFKMKFLCLKMT